MTFSNKSKTINAKWNIKTFKQKKKYIADFMIKFEALAMKAETNDLHIIFLLKKNIQMDIIKIIMGYPPMAALGTLRKQKVAIISIEQEYKSTESQQDYKIRTRTIYREKGIPMNIGKAKDNFDKDGKPRCFNCNVYRYIAKDYKKPKNE